MTQKEQILNAFDGTQVIHENIETMPEIFENLPEGTVSAISIKLTPFSDKNFCVMCFDEHENTIEDGTFLRTLS